MAARNANTNAAAQADKPQVVFTRVFDAPRELVFKAWTEPERLKRWFGPQQFTLPLCEVDLRPGGALRMEMRGPDGTAYPMTGVFQEIVEPSRLVFSTAPLDEKGEPLFEVLNIVTLEEHEGKTKLTLEARVTKTTPQAKPYLEGMHEGWIQTLDRLEQELAR
jgi:uncharacterized protein YndB with AHSA1/START domain